MLDPVLVKSEPISLVGLGISLQDSTPATKGVSCGGTCGSSCPPPLNGAEGGPDNAFFGQLESTEVVPLGNDGDRRSGSGVGLKQLQVDTVLLDDYGAHAEWGGRNSAGGSCSNTCNTCQGNTTCSGSCGGSCSNTCNPPC